MTLPQIYCDMDGVLADFIGGLCDYYRRDELKHNWPRGEWNVCRAMDLPNWDAAAADMGFWANLEPTPQCRSIANYFTHQLKADWCVLTKPAETAGCYAGKMAWFDRVIKRHHPKVRLIACPIDKSTLAASGRILIEDNELNAARWCQRRGTAVMLGRPWNSGKALAWSESPKGSSQGVHDYVQRIVNNLTTFMTNTGDFA